jgi:hypothetical protein
MKTFWLDAILKPLAAIIFCLIFGLPFVYTGFQSIVLNGTKDDQGNVTIDFTRKHFFGLYRVEKHIEGVENATLKSSLVRRSGIRNTRKTLVSGVFLETQNEAIRLIAGSSDVNDALKLDVVRSVNQFIDDVNQNDYQNKIRLSNIFGWFGLPFLVLGVLGLIGWPFSIIKYLKD